MCNKKKGSVYSDDIVKGVTINFKPENSKGEKLTSRALKELVTFEAMGWYKREEFTDPTSQKKVVQFTLMPVDYQTPRS